MNGVVESPAIRRACTWIAEEELAGSAKNLGDLAMDAARRFDLSPLEAEFLLRLVRRAREAGKEGCSRIP